MITNYRASAKTRKPFCGYGCCGSTGWGLIERSCYAVIHNQNKKKQMRRYARHADKVYVRKEILFQLLADEEYYQAEALTDEVALAYEDYDYDYYEEYDSYEDNSRYEDDYYEDYCEQSEIYHRLYKFMQEEYLNGALTAKKYHKIIKVLNERD